MIIAYHAIFTTYGTWLPNDPRGSYSKTVYNAELAQLREIHYGRQSPQPDRNTIRRFRVAAMPRLSRPPHYLTNETRPRVADAFAKVVDRLHLSVPACAIMKDHVHFLVWRSKQPTSCVFRPPAGQLQCFTIAGTAHERLAVAGTATWHRRCAANPTPC